MSPSSRQQCSDNFCASFCAQYMARMGFYPGARLRGTCSLQASLLLGPGNASSQAAGVFEGSLYEALLRRTESWEGLGSLARSLVV